MRGIVRTGLIGLVVLGSVSVADEVRAVPVPGSVVSITHSGQRPRLG